MNGVSEDVEDEDIWKAVEEVEGDLEQDVRRRSMRRMQTWHRQNQIPVKRQSG